MRTPSCLSFVRIFHHPQPSRAVHITPVRLAKSYNDTSRQPTAAEWSHPVYSSAAIVHHKSGFQAHATALKLSTAGTLHSTSTLTAATQAAITSGAVSNISGSEAQPDLEPLFSHLVARFPRTKRATHCMYAWRARPPRLQATDTRTSSTPRSLPLSSGSSDGGESGAGARLDHLLALSGCVDVVVVVYRWYGGVQLGAERWKCISGVAKEALRAGGFMGEKDTNLGAVEEVDGKTKGKEKKGGGGEKGGKKSRKK